MRVCPKCGHKEIIWRHMQHMRFTDYCHISELELEQPELAQKLWENPKFLTDGVYNYQLNKSGFVHRIWREDAVTPNLMKEPDMEKPKNRLEIAILYRKVFPPQSEFVEQLRVAIAGKEDLLHNSFGNRWKHWIRRDNSGFCYPTWEDWLLLKEKLHITISASLIKSEQTRLLEEVQQK